MKSKENNQDKDKKHVQKAPGIFSLLKPYSGLVLLLMLFALLSNGLNLFIPKLIGAGIDAYHSGTFSYKTVALEFSITVLVIFLFTALQGWVQTYASEKVARDLRTSLTDKISRQSFAYIQTANPSSLLTNLTSDIDSIKLFVSQAMVSISSSIFIIVGASILLLSINWELGLIVMAIIPLIGGSFYVVLSKVRVLFKKSREVIDWLNKVINESILGAMLIRVVNSQQMEYDKFFEASTKSKDIGLSILRLFAWLIPVIIFIANVTGLMILVVGGHYVINQKMTLGDFAAFNSYLALLIFPILVIGFMSNVIAQANASYARISGLLSRPDTVETGILETKLSGEAAVKEVNVTYGERQVLKNISFSIKRGSKTAIIGPTAAGKTQLLYLLSGLIKPGSGTITYDGQPIDQYISESFYQQVGLVFQDSVLFNMSIRENITFSESVTEESLQKAIETAELSDFVETLPKGLDTLVSERGISLSGGQKQRIMLARALAINPQILLLDDFTARVDNQTESRILANLQRNYPELTLISVTQKVAAVADYEQIILLMQGELLASGTHGQLMASSPEYVQIFNSQQSTSNYEL